jgi:hypothetical protein
VSQLTYNVVQKLNCEVSVELGLTVGTQLSAEALFLMNLRVPYEPKLADDSLK